MGILQVLLICIYTVSVSNTQEKIQTFPDGFMFGVATSAFQIEGGWNKDGKGPSVWDSITHENPSPIKDGSNAEIAADSYHLYKEDIQLMKDLGVTVYRFSISWPRILPNGFPNQINPAGIEYYNNLINELIVNDIMPMVTMYHWDLPLDLQKIGGWANPYVIDWFEDYATILYENFGDRVKNWITINEPMQFCSWAYGSTKFPPALNVTGTADYYCAKNVLLAHAKAYRIYENKYKQDQGGRVGISIACSWFEPATDSPEDEQAALDAIEFESGLYINPIFSNEGDFPQLVRRIVDQKSAEQGFARSRLPSLSPEEILMIKGSSDFLGINVYTSYLVTRNESVEDKFPIPSFGNDQNLISGKFPSLPTSDNQLVQEAPWGFTNLLKYIKRKYNNPPVIITENGWESSGGLDDDDRIKYITNYLSAMLDAMEDGCDVRCYCLWTLLDGFEWSSGYSLNFGLYEVDFTSPNRTRTPRKSVSAYKEIIRTRQVSPIPNEE